MAENAASEILDALMRNLREILHTESIIGQPIVVGKMTILPVIKVYVGFGAGGGSGSPEKGNSGGKGMMAVGGGGGGGLAITPVGFLVVEEGRAMMITPGSGKWNWIVESIPDLWEKLARIYQDGKERTGAKSEAAAGESAPPPPDSKA